MDNTIKIALLGPLTIEIDNQPVEALVSVKAQAILSYLLFQPRPLPRQTIATLFWGEMPEEDARRNLRGVVMKLRHHLDPFLQIDNQQIGFDFQSAHWVDARQFEEHIRIGEKRPLQAAIALYRGEFMQGFVLRDAPEFESWQERERTKYHQLVLQAHDTLLTLYEQEEAWQAGVDLARRLIELEPTREASHRYLIRLLARMGRGDTAVDQFERLRALLENELQVDASAETRQLIEDIRQGRLGPIKVLKRPLPQPPPNLTSAPIEPPPPFIAGPPITYPARFFGREGIVKRVFRLFQKRPFQNAAIIGPRRSGKTSLLHYLMNIHTAPAAQKRPEQRSDWLNDAAHYRWVFVDFQDARLGELPRLLNHLLTEMALSVPEVCDLESFLDIVAAELQSPTIILFDEIGVALSRYGKTLDDAFWESLRSLATNQVNGRLGFVLSSHQMPSELAQSQGFGSPFFNIFGYTAVLRAFSDAEARQLIATSPIPFPENDVAWILDKSQRWPMPLQMLCRERLLTLEEGELGEAWREEAAHQLARYTSSNEAGSGHEPT